MIRLGTVVLLSFAALAVAPPLRPQVAPQSAAIQPPAPRNVLMVHLGSETFPVNPILDAGIREAFSRRPDVPVVYNAEYLESEVFTLDAATLAFKNYIAGKYADRRIDLVMVNTDRALRFVESNRAELFPDAPIVFAGNTTRDDRTRAAGPGMTGIRLGTAYGDTLKLALALHPGVEHVFVIANSPDSLSIDAVRAQLRDFSSLTFTYLTERKLDDLLSAVRAIPEGSILLYVWHFESEQVNVIYSDEIARRVAGVSPVPVYGTSDFYIGSGVVGGVVRSTTETGNHLGEMALRILTGTRAQDIPLETARVAPFIDWRAFRQWGLAESRLPAGTRVFFREPTLWERYRGYVVAAVVAFVVQALLIGALLIQRARRRGAETALRRSYARVRDLGARLLSAQDDERSRIARELHDDISQRLAVLKIDLTVLRRFIHGEGESLAMQALTTADAIAKDVRELSHRLHPSRLRLMGLTAAIAGLQAELTRPGVGITFAHEGVPARLPRDVTVSLYRVVQEALHNALKYSEARVITIDLKGSERELALTIADDGVGFDADGPAGTGLGLTSMRERVDALGGTVEIRSRPGAGTTLEIRVPVPVTPAPAGRVAV